VSYIMVLIRRATRLALTHGRERLDDELLAQAYTERLAGERRQIDNPFIGDAPVSKAPKPPLSPPPKQHRQSRRGASK
jgi:hypothetical protein